MGDRKPPSGLSRTVTNMLRKLNVVGREEDKLAGYLQLLKTGPKLLKFLPGKKVRDVANWLTIYSYWNAGGPQNVSTMVAFISREYLNAARTTGHLEQLPPPVEIPAIGLVHPSRPGHFFNAPRSYLEWYFEQFPERVDRPRVGILLYRKHVVSGQEYIGQMIEHLEYYQLVPVPVFINGVEGHIVVREFFTSKYELEQRERGIKNCPLKERDAVIVNVILSTIGFSLVGGPAGSMSAGRQTNVSRNILKTKNVPFIVGAPLLIQDKESWLSNGIGGLQSVVLYALPELDGSIDTVPLGGLVRDRIVLEPGRLQRLAGRIKAWTKLQRLQPRERKVAIVLYGYPPGQGATGTAALLNVPESLRNVLCRLDQEGYNVGNALDLDPQDLLLRIKTADEIMEARADSRAVGERMSEVTWVPASSLDGWIGEHNVERIRNQWSGQAVQIKSAGDRLLLGGVLLGNVWIGVQPPLGIAGDPMRLMFERDMTPHPQYAAFYRWIEEDFGASAIVHFGMHGTYEWLPGSPLGNTDSSWSDILLGNLPNLYIYAANNPSESALAKRRGYSTVISHCVPPYGRAGLYSELIIVRDLVDEYLEKSGASEADETLYNDIVQKMETTGLSEEFPLIRDELDRYSYVLKVKSYLKELENRLFSSGLHVYGGVVDCRGFVEALLQDVPEVDESTLGAVSAGKTFREINGAPMSANSQARVEEAIEVRRLLQTSATELDSLAKGLNGEFIEAAPAGDVLRDGASVLPTGRNIYSIDPYRMPSNAAFTVGKTIAEKMILNAGDDIPETVAVPLWGLDNIKTRGESVGIVLGLVGAEPVRDATGRIARFQLIPLKELGRPRIDVLANISGIFRDSFEHVVFLLDDMFKSAAEATDEPLELNFIRKHSLEILAEHGPVEESSARLFSNPVGEFGSMVNERISAGNWDNSQELGDTWKSRNSFAFGRNVKGKKQARTLDTLLATTGQILQQIDSVEYGLTRNYWANSPTNRLCRVWSYGHPRYDIAVEPHLSQLTPTSFSRVLRQHRGAAAGRAS
eukprot:Plantae.Rhodophyta-Rhodochaete_pulchella.ctg2296.p1 GENE.Plantae.Rhodophyta-Rhodochaete_pulchella.ctg2296~~Plantae.Rhodophyta-Rhodochaete_pulchella.ctg2296.p1  ORF type:complete len:1159 (-),score=161.50 Plantae.Rhodophyta-Rhodochaete_pulchella.ctg2296:1889-4996(-)